MTTITWDGHTLATDRAMESRGVLSETTKIVECPTPQNGWPPGAFAGAGNVAYLTQYAMWINGIAQMPTCPEAEADNQCGLYVTSTGYCWLAMKRGVLVESRAGMEADGSGFEFALACMVCGKTARQAIELTAEYTQDAAMGVQIWTPP